MKIINFLIQLSVFALASSCTHQAQSPSLCVKGKYLGPFCVGHLIEILDNHTLGSELKGVNGKLYKNESVVDFDTNSFKPPITIKIFPRDSVFYFQYKDGGYPRFDMKACGPSASIIIINISSNPCLSNN